MIKIGFFDAKDYEKEYFNLSNEKYGFKIDYFESRLGGKSSLMASNHDAIVAFVNDDLSAEVINNLKKNKVKLIALRSAGFNNVDLEQAKRCDIPVCRVPEYSPYAVAEHTVGLLLALNRKLHKSYLRTREGNFSLSGLVGFDLNAKTAGVIGLGSIGKKVAKILEGFGMKLLGYDPNPDYEFAKECGLEYVEINELYKQSHVISLNCPLNKYTYHLIDSHSIEKMRNDVIILNTGRGGLINTKDLINGLKKGKVGGAALDVYEEEDKYFFEDHSNLMIMDDDLARLLLFNNVLITSHQGFLTKEALTNIADTTLENINSFFIEGELMNAVTL